LSHSKVAACLLPVGLIVYLVSTAHRGLRSPSPSQVILDRRGTFLGEVPAGDDTLGYWPMPYVMPERIVRATIETEDRHFYEHAGVRWSSVARAVAQNVRHFGRVSGASTIAMQVARMQSPESRSMLHKAREAVEALWLVRDFGHEQVLRQYLNVAPYGNRAHGAVRAARLYFDKPVEDLSWLQAAFLAALPQAPGRMNPYEPAGLKRGMRRAHRILVILNQRGIISHDELEQALHANLGLVHRLSRADDALHAVIALSDRARRHGGTTVHATLDLDLQEKVAHLLQENLERLGGLAGNTAALVIDTAHGDVLVSVGSSDYFDTADHGALDYVRVKRSPGSTLKPFIYALALESGRWTAGSEIPDTPADYSADEDGGTYMPENFNHAFLGPMLLREALGNSRNIPALRVLSDVGVEKTLRLFEAGGVQGISWEPGRYGLGLAIGNLEVTPEELARLYLVLAHDGVATPLRLLSDESETPGPRLLRTDTARLITNILSDPLARRPSFPAGSALDFDDMAVAVKTGTSQGHRDAWTVAYSDRILVVVWVGNHDRRRMGNLTGGSAAGQVAHQIIEAVMPEREPYRAIEQSFPPPRGYNAVSVCPISGKLAGPDCPDAKVEYFAPGTEPVEHCPYHVKVKLDRRTGLRAGPSCPAQFITTRPMLDLPHEYRDWARGQRIELAPERYSPLCPLNTTLHPSVTVREPRDRARFLFDPDTPDEAAGIRLAAEVQPAEEEIVWIVDGSPVARVGYPFELRLPLKPGNHTIRAAMAQSDTASRPVTVTVEN
jgi:penicillin-binding protein 1C